MNFSEILSKCVMTFSRIPLKFPIPFKTFSTKICCIPQIRISKINNVKECVCRLNIFKFIIIYSSNFPSNFLLKIPSKFPLLIKFYYIPQTMIKIVTDITESVCRLRKNTIYLKKGLDWPF